MKNVFFKYPSIQQFRNVAHDVLTDGKKVVEFERTVKIHGTNAAIVYNTLNPVGDNKLYAQSRNRLLTIDNDNAGFAAYVEEHKEKLYEVFQQHLPDELGNWDSETHAVLYGEWCGNGIQSNVVVNKLPKMFVVFGIRIIGSSSLSDPYTRWGDTDYDEDLREFPYHEPRINLYNIKSFGHDIVSINFEDPVEAQQRLLDDANSVGVHCPVGTWFGLAGAGEGHVYSSLCGKHTFKMKCDAHTVSKTKYVPDDLAAQINEATVFVDLVLTENRLNQGIEYLDEMQLPKYDYSSIGTFIKWLIEDIEKEEGDVIVSNNLDARAVKRLISKKGLYWFKTNSLLN